MTDEHFDVVVIGSGFGGSVTAYRLAEAGRSVLLLERGAPYPPGSFAVTPRALRTNFWAPEEELYGLFDVWSFSGLDVVLSSGLGGGSLIYANVMLRKEADTFVQENLFDGGREYWPITRADLEPHYDRVEAMQRPQRFPIAHQPYASTKKTLAMLRAANNMQLQCELPPLAVTFANDGEPPVPGEPIREQHPNLHGRTRQTCRLCGECDIGCNFGAKNTLDYTYLSAAQRAGAQIRTCCEARAVAPREDGGRGYRVGYHQHLEARNGHDEALLDPVADRREREVLADRVVLGAGAVGSSHLLLRNRASFPAISPALGSRVSANGDGIGFARNTRKRGANGQEEWNFLDPSSGPVITASIHVPEEKSPSGRSFYLQDAGAPAFTEWLWQPLEGMEDLWRMRKTFARRIWQRLRGRRDTHLSEELAEFFGTTRASAAMLPLLGMGRDIPNGRLKLRGDTLDCDWDPEASDSYYDALHEGFHRLAKELGDPHRHDLLENINRVVSSHVLGGCPMGDDARTSVVDAWGEVHGCRGLFVADGAAMPGPVGPNPSFTIAAFADRVADGMIEGRAA